MARAHALIAAEAENYSDPGEVMRHVNRHVTRLEKKTTQFVTVFYGILNIETGELRYARAGHEPALILLSDGSVERMPHKSGMAIGLWEDIALDEDTVTLTPGSTLLLYTDGMTDCRNPGGEPFGLDGIKELLSGYVDLSAQEICDRMLQTLKDYQNGAKQDDDVTLVAVHAKKL
jgi:sigma-B regulation protein RsbU (phosphoserine phosphatase)